MAFLLQLQCCIDIIVNDIMVGFATVAFLHTDAPFRIWRHISSFVFGVRVLTATGSLVADGARAGND